MDVVDTLHGRAESFTRSIQPCLGEEYTIETDRHGAAHVTMSHISMLKEN